jgi:hypothetical protein
MGQICAFRPIREFLPRKPSLLSFACADRWTTSVSRALAHAIDVWGRVVSPFFFLALRPHQIMGAANPPPGSPEP